MAATKSLGEVLDAAADLIEPEGAWTQGAWARAPSGAEMSPFLDYARCFCIRGALVKVLNVRLRAEMPAVQSALGFSTASAMARWNDAPERTQAEVVAKLREAAERARNSSDLVS